MLPEAGGQGQHFHVFTIRTDPKPVNNLIFIFFQALKRKKKSRKKTHASVTVTVVRDRKIRTALRANQIVGFVTVPAWKKKIKLLCFLLLGIVGFFISASRFASNENSWTWILFRNLHLFVRRSCMSLFKANSKATNSSCPCGMLSLPKTLTWPVSRKNSPRLSRCWIRTSHHTLTSTHAQ